MKYTKILSSSILNNSNAASVKKFVCKSDYKYLDKQWHNSDMQLAFFL